ncbi:LPS export ABC transporter permease LptG [Sphingomonas nostoxanthinifaciens]|uniref:LPS export ABC transporter permease LptG n=1 Tax=Sphingomonas nostoxanthinifaciens TaxID=2872652 RepID=UPI001CC1DD89|nr:LPS export ABC transporter permease LptG [Sphingomonas nostoxanthinifaciens]UAK23400.1 LPS export ABC transporter permease LptG [Sphingomonas nostoxanthinifaciens]
MKVNLNFFASRTIAWYMARLFVSRSAAVLAALTIILLSLDLLGESGDILAYPGNGNPQLWYYLSLRAPQIIARFLPFSVLLGTLITLVTMNQNSEVISMKAAGISAHQILAPLVLASLAIAGVSFVFNDHVVARATAALSAWQQVDYGPVPKSQSYVPNVWVRSGDDLIHAERVVGRGAAAVLVDVSFYDRTGDRLTSVASARIGRYRGGAWQLSGVRRFDVAAGRIASLPTLVVGQGVTPDRFTLADVQPDSLSFAALRRSITELHAAGRPTANLETVLWHKLSGPLSAVLMPLLAGVAGFGLARSGALFIRAVIGMALGFTYFVADNFALAMGNIGAYPPLLAAWAPFLLFLLIGEAVLIRTEE